MNMKKSRHGEVVVGAYERRMTTQEGIFERMRVTSSIVLISIGRIFTKATVLQSPPKSHLKLS